MAGQSGLSMAKATNGLKGSVLTGGRESCCRAGRVKEIVGCPVSLTLGRVDGVLCPCWR